MLPPPGSGRDFTDEDLDWIVSHGIPRPVAAGRCLVREGERVDVVYVVLEGSFAVSSESLGIDFLWRLGPGEIVRETLSAAGAPPLATVRAETDATVLEVPWRRLEERMRRDAGFGDRFPRVVAGLTEERVRILRERLACEGGRGGPRRPLDAGGLRVHEMIERLLRGDFL